MYYNSNLVVITSDYYKVSLVPILGRIYIVVARTATLVTFFTLEAKEATTLFTYLGIYLEARLEAITNLLILNNIVLTIRLCFIDLGNI